MRPRLRLRHMVRVRRRLVVKVRFRLRLRGWSVLGLDHFLRNESCTGIRTIRVLVDVSIGVEVRVRVAFAIDLEFRMQIGFRARASGGRGYASVAGWWALWGDTEALSP